VTAIGENEFKNNTAVKHAGAIYVTYVTVKEGENDVRVGTVLNMTDGLFEGNTSMGGGAVSIRTAGKATFNGTTFKDNAVTGDDGKADGDGEGGGAIYVGYGELTLVDVTAIGNTAEGFGGAVDSIKSTITVTGGLFENNKANTGGAFFALSDSNLTFTETEFKANESTYENTDYKSEIGGGAINITDGSLTLSGVTLDGNKSGWYGGAVIATESIVNINNNTVAKNNIGKTGVAFSFRYGCTITMTDTVIENNLNGYNSAVYIGAANATITNVTATGNSSTNGAVFYVSSGSNVTITGGTFTNNSATSGGVIYATGTTSKVTVEGSTFSGNTAKNGGAVYVDGATVTLNNVTATGNTVTVNGGALHLSNAATVNIKGGSFERNTSNLAGAIYNSGSTLNIDSAKFIQNSSTSNGGAISTVGGTTTVVGESEFKNNTSGGHGGAIYVSYITLEDEAKTKVPGIFNMTDGLFESNSAATAGGAISSRTSCEVTLTGTTLKNNSI
ncbi:MAG: hypothetical protein IKY19_08995, partial [Bacteroidaceae bacterium]|nr:hypothetical protein [Bacteroidaceae bacterium]